MESNEPDFVALSREVLSDSLIQLANQKYLCAMMWLMLVYFPLKLNKSASKNMEVHLYSR